MGGTSNGVVVDLPSGTTSGDLLVAFIAYAGYYNPPSSVPSGWTQLTWGAYYPTVTVRVYYKIAGGSEPSDYTWIWGSNSWYHSGSIHRITGAATSSPLYVYSGTSGFDETPVAPSVNATASDTLLLAFAAFTASSTFTPPSGMTEVSDFGGTGMSHTVASLNLSATGSTGSKSFDPATSGSNFWATLVVGVAPAPTSVSGTATGSGAGDGTATGTGGTGVTTVSGVALGTGRGTGAAVGTGGTGGTGSGSIGVAPGGSRYGGCTPVPVGGRWSSSPRNAVDIVWEVLDRSLNTVGTVHPFADSGPSVSVSSAGAVGRSLRSVQLTPEETAELNPRYHMIRPVAVDNIGQCEPLGAFSIAGATATETAVGELIDITFTDQPMILTNWISKNVSYRRDKSVANVIENIGDLLGLPSVYVEPNADNLGEPMTWTRGSATWWDVLKKLAEAGGYFPPYFDRSGAMHVKLVPEYEGARPQRTFSSNTSDNARLSLTRSIMFMDAPNVWYAVNNASVHTPIKGRYALANSAPNSINRVGYEIPADLITNPGLKSVAAANRAARAKAHSAPYDIGTATLKTLFDPTLDVYDLYVIDGLRYRSVGLTVPLDGESQMTHELRRVYTDQDEDGSLFAGVL